MNRTCLLVFHRTLLIDRGADVNAVSDDGKTAFHYACSRHRENVNVAQVLLKTSIDLNVKDRSGKTAEQLKEEARLWIEGECELISKL